MLLKMHTFCARSSRCFLFQTQNHRSVRVTTSRKQEGTKAERSVLLYNNRCCCTTTDPRRVSKQVSREPPQAWLFGLVRFGAPGRTKSAAGRTKAPQASSGRQANSARRRPEKIRDLLRSALLARFSLVLLPQSSNSGGRSMFTSKGTDRREGAQASQKLCAVFSFFPRSRP